jgi:hypothetical protein
MIDRIPHTAALAAAGLALIGALFVLVQRARARGTTAGGRMLDQRLHYGLVGAIAGFAAVPDLRASFTSSVVLAAHFLVGWYGLTIGLALDRRLFRRSLTPHLLLDVTQATVVAAAILVASYAAWGVLPQTEVPAMAGFILAGLCAAIWPVRPWGKAGRGKWHLHAVRPSVAACLGILVAGIGTLSLRYSGFEIQLPLEPASKAIVVDTLAGKMLCTIALGAATGIILDLLTRGVGRLQLLLLVTGGLAIGAGTGAGLGLEPAWIGVIAGAWLINSTLRRLELLRSAQRAQPAMRIGLLCVAGWTFGSGVVQHGLAVLVMLAVLLLVCVMRPLAMWCGWLAARRIAAAGWIKHPPQRERELLTNIESMGLALAIGLCQLLDGPAGVAALGAVLISQWIYCLMQAWAGRPVWSPRASSRQGDPKAAPQPAALA